MADGRSSGFAAPAGAAKPLAQKTWNVSPLAMTGPVGRPVFEPPSGSMLIASAGKFRSVWSAAAASLIVPRSSLGSIPSDSSHPQLVRFARHVRDEHRLVAAALRRAEDRDVGLLRLRRRHLDPLDLRHLDDLRLLERERADERGRAAGGDEAPAAPEREALPEPRLRPHHVAAGDARLDRAPHPPRRSDLGDADSHRREPALPLPHRAPERRILAHPGLKAQARAATERAEHVLRGELVLQLRLVAVPHLNSILSMPSIARARAAPRSSPSRAAGACGSRAPSGRDRRRTPA